MDKDDQFKLTDCHFILTKIVTLKEDGLFKMGIQSSRQPMILTMAEDSLFTKVCSQRFRSH